MTPTSTPPPRLEEGRRVWLNLYPEHRALLQNPSKWLGFLDDLYDTLIDLVNDNPCPDRKLEIREVAHLPANIGARAWPNFIEWNCNVVCAELGRINEGDVSWGIPHEFGHVFDTEPARQYYIGADSTINNKEQWANLKVVYSFEELSSSYPGATAYIGHPPAGIQMRTLPIADIGTDYFVQVCAQPYLSSERCIDHDAFTGLLYMVKQEIGWEPFRQTFHDYRIGRFPASAYRTDEQKRSLLVNLLSNHARQDLCPRFRQWGLQVNWVIPRAF